MPSIGTPTEMESRLVVARGPSAGRVGSDS